jgi:hypothetical protein
MSVLFLKWEKKTIEILLKLTSDIYVIIDENSLPWAKKDIDLFSKIRKVYAISSMNSLEELSAIAMDIRLNDFKIEKILNYSEYSQYAAGFLADLLEIQNYSFELALKSRDKRWMKYCLKQSNLATANFISFTDLNDKQNQEIAVNKLGLPLVIKPANGFGTMNTKRIDSNIELNNFAESIRYESKILSRHFIAESFINGDEYHIDAVWNDNHNPVYFAISKYLTTRISIFEKGAHLNGSYTLPRVQFESLYEQFLQFHIKINESINIKSGVTHLELFFQPTTGILFFSEIATRLGGSAITEVTRHLCGYDLRELWLKQVVEGADAVYHFRSPEHCIIGCLNVLPKRSGKIKSLPTTKMLNSFPCVLESEINLEIGDTIEISNPSVGAIVLTVGADTILEFENKCKELYIQIENTIEIELDKE